MAKVSWQQRQEELVQKFAEYINGKKGLKALIFYDGEKPYVRVFFSEKIAFDCQLKSVKSSYVIDVWVVPKIFFDRDSYYVVYSEKQNFFYILSGIDVIRIAEEKLSTYKKSLIYLVVPMKNFISVSAWIKMKKREVEEKLQKLLTDF